MLKEIVEVVSVIDKKIKIRFTPRVTCSCCKFGLLCGKGNVELDIDRKDFYLEKGNKIEVGMEEKKSLLINSIVFLVPVIIFILSLYSFRKRGEFLSFIIAVFLVAGYYLTVKLILKDKKYFHLQILRKI